MRSFFSRTPDLEGGGGSRTYKKGFTGDHRGRTHIPPNPSPLFSPQSQLNPFSAPSATYRHDTIFKPPPSPSPKSVAFSEQSWGGVSGVGVGIGGGGGGGNGNGNGRQGNGNGNGNEAAVLDRSQLDRLHEYLGVLPSTNIPPRGRRGFSMSDPNERPIPLTPQARIPKSLKQKAAEQQFRGYNYTQQQRHALRRHSHHSHDALLGDEDKGESQVRFQTHVFKEALKTAMSLQRDDEQEQGFAELGMGMGMGVGVGGLKRPVMQRRGASEGMREGGFVGPEPLRVQEELVPRDLGEFLEKYDPRAEDLPDVYPMSEHRTMLRMMYLEDILHSTAKLHKHHWVLLSRNDKYKGLRVPERWDQIQEDLEKYTRSIRNYETWLASSLPLLALSKASLPPRFHLYGKQLAILEAAKHFSHPSELALTNELERKLVAYHTDWSLSNGVWRGLRWETRKGWRRGRGRGFRAMGRVLGAVLGGACVMAPVAVLVLWPGGVGRRGGIGVVGVSVLVVGFLLAWGMGGEEKKRGWDGFEGRDRERCGNGLGLGFRGEWGGSDVMFVLAGYAAVLVLFLGVAVV